MSSCDHVIASTKREIINIFPQWTAKRIRAQLIQPYQWPNGHWPRDCVLLIRYALHFDCRWHVGPSQPEMRTSTPRQYIQSVWEIFGQLCSYWLSIYQFAESIQKVGCPRAWYVKQRRISKCFPLFWHSLFVTKVSNNTVSFDLNMSIFVPDKEHSLGMLEKSTRSGTTRAWIGQKKADNPDRHKNIFF